MRIKKYRVFDMGRDHNYFNEQGGNNLNNRKILEKVARKCYLPANGVLLKLLQKYPEFKVSFSLSGIFLEACERFCPEVIVSFQKLIETGRVEILSETYYHSLSFLYSQSEFIKQVELHKKRIKELFKLCPTVFRNTELIYNNDLAKLIEDLGYDGILAEGADHVLGWRSPNFVYHPQGAAKLKLLLKNYKLSDDIAFRFSSKAWSEYPLKAPKFAQWVSAVNGNGEVINLFMDYETFGEHQWEDTGIFEFLNFLPGEILKHPDNNFVTPSEAISRYQPAAVLDIPHFISWADTERDLSAWMSNSIQKDALEKIYGLEKMVMASRDDKLIEDWRKLTTSDHFYYMCTKWWSDGDVHKYFNPYSSPYEAFISYMNVFNDLKLRIESKKRKEKKAPIAQGKDNLSLNAAP